MKRVVTIGLLSVFLLNTLGYYGILWGWKWKNSRDLNNQLSEESSTKLTTQTFKIPLSVPYGVDSRDYERVEGEFQYKGETFRLVKQRLYRDTLELVVLKDVKSHQINQALADYVKTFTDKPEHSKQSAKVSIDFSKDFISTTIATTSLQAGWEIEIPSSSPISKLQASFIASIIQPPEGLSA